MTSRISDQKYVAITTYRRDGSAKAVPVWIADLGDGTVGFTTGSSSYKVKRIANDPRVTLQASDGRGRVKAGSEPVSGTARVTAADFDRVSDAIAAKYGVQYRLIGLLGKVGKLIGKGSGTDTAVIITLAAGDHEPQPQ